MPAKQVHCWSIQYLWYRLLCNYQDGQEMGGIDSLFKALLVLDLGESSMTQKGVLLSFMSPDNIFYTTVIFNCVILLNCLATKCIQTHEFYI